MPPRKGQNPTDANPARERLLALAGLLKSPHEEATLALVERAFSLKGGMLKDQVKRGAISKGLASRLVERAGAVGITELTTDWLLDGRGKRPHRGGEMPLPQPLASDPNIKEGMRLAIEAMEEFLRILRERWGIPAPAVPTPVVPHDAGDRQAISAARESLPVAPRRARRGRSHGSGGGG